MQTNQVILKRTSNTETDFKKLISKLDKYLSIVNGEQDAFYAPNNVLDPLDTAVIAYYNNKPVGCGCFKRYDEDSVEIKRMYVDPDLRGRGIASTILNELEKWAKENGFKYTVLETGLKLDDANALYRKQGYEVIENYGQYAGITSSVCMKKTL
ncbi:GNAT family N-acetyltransferase [Mucilaginibacter sp. E4BP6]|uniref:GNAT family N-acetyltransferase n=1 Tax=Mucilaginibacter sp. E4BP6 TaxID=2723089 RepID=UPI0015CB5C19|nr:GNAT family N-acetyltransferase [Mucilaginibacter sp. E4BP6]NYE65591.1 GNAT superfamily N-acetyltransferase [Mucilaginibacter sp. E4BP6]